MVSIGSVFFFCVIFTGIRVGGDGVGVDFEIDRVELLGLFLFWVMSL